MSTITSVDEAKKQLVDTFLNSYGDRYKGAMSEEELRATLLSLSLSQLAGFVAESANAFDFADLEVAENAE